TLFRSITCCRRERAFGRCPPCGPPSLSAAAPNKGGTAMRVVKSREPNRRELMKNPIFAMIVAGAIALGSPNVVLAAGRTRAGDGHAVERVAARPFVGRGY